jgi:DNA-binding NarL/FixJ family response regulator
MDEAKSQKKITVFVADDSIPVRDRLVALLSGMSELEVVGQAAGVAETVNQVRMAQPEIVILDMRLSDGSGLDVLHALQQDQPRPKVIVLTNYPFEQYRRKCLEAGASRFYDKSTEFHKIPQAIAQLRTSAAGGQG